MTVEFTRVRQFAIGKSEEFNRGVAEKCEGGARLGLTLRGVAGLRAIGRHGHMNLSALAQMQRHQTAATDHFIVRMRRQNEQALAA